MREALFYEKAEGGAVQCGLCRFRCRIPDGGRGICSVRENRGGTLYTLVYGKAVAEHVDPIEKKPLFHVLPGSLTYSIATVGCNFRCLHCQNYSISQPVHGRLEISGIERSPDRIVESALAAGCKSIAYTYTEPTIFYEYALDTAILARKNGLKNIFVTNGYITAEALAHIAPWLDAANIDLKGFTQRFYREVAHASLDEVLESIVEYRRLGIWIELTTLIIPTLNDSSQELNGIARFIAQELGAETPWHVTQFYPTYRLTTLSRTPAEALRRARQAGVDAGLRHVYVGNVVGEGGESTFCSGCRKLLVSRTGFHVNANLLVNGHCPSCAASLAGIGLLD